MTPKPAVDLSLRPLSPFRSLRVQLWVVIAILVAMLVGSASYTFRELSLRKHDYLILNLTGQMRVTSLSMADQARHYVNLTSHSMTEMARYYASQTSDDSLKLRQYGETLQRQIDSIDKIITSLKAGRIDAPLLGKNESIRYAWDTRLRREIDLAARDWSAYRLGLLSALGDNAHEPRLIDGIQFIATHGDELTVSADRLAQALQVMMEERLDAIRNFQLLAGGLTLLLLGSIAAVVHFKVLQPLQQTVAGFGRVAQGNLGHQVPILADNEIGRLTRSFNGLSNRLHALFRLTDRINRGKQLDETLDFILEEFPAFVPVDWVGVLFPAEGEHGLRLERMAGVAVPGLQESGVFTAGRNDLAQVTEKQRPWAIEDLASYTLQNPDAQLAGVMAAAGLGSALYLPLAGERSGGVMVFAARNVQAYTAGHMEFLDNIAAQVGHILERTVVVEGLVVAALQGLAKLAESRDPETGDHLMRMSLYSVFIAEELGTTGRHAGKINSAYVRNIYRFAPMHDIGKVGISDSILLKPGRLDEAERREMERHPSIGGEALRGSEAQMNALGHSIFTIGIEIAECHHEKWDGSGYPARLSNDAIPLSARIVAVADVFDALTSKRPYKDAWPVEKALSAINDASGSHFDPEVVLAFHRAMPKIMDIYDKHKCV